MSQEIEYSGGYSIFAAESGQHHKQSKGGDGGIGQHLFHIGLTQTDYRSENKCEAAKYRQNRFPHRCFAQNGRKPHQQIFGPRWPGNCRRDHRATAIGDDAVVDFGQRELRCLRGHANVALQRQFAAATDGIAANGGDERLLAVQHLELALLAAGHMREIADAFCPHAKRGGVSASAKRSASALQQNGPHLGIVLRLRHRLAKGGAHLVVHRVVAMRAVERDDRNRRGDLQFDAVGQGLTFPQNGSSGDPVHDQADVLGAARLAVMRAVGKLRPIGQQRLGRGLW